MVKTNNLNINLKKKNRNGKKKFLLSADEKLKLAAEISSKTAEQRFDKFSNQLVKSAKHIYSEKATYHELTEGMRAWVLKKSDIKKAFHLTRSFFTHLNKGEHMLLSGFVRFTNWIFTHYPSEEVCLKVWMGIGTVLFCHTKENADYGWHPFGVLPKELACR